MKKIMMMVVAAMLLALPAMAQEQMGRIEGKVTTEDGFAITGAKVLLSSDALVAGTLETVTDNGGRYRFQLLPIGTYTLKVTAEQYQSYEQSGIIVRIGATVTINPALKAGAFEQVITITGEAPLIDVTSTDMGENLGKELIAKLPVPRFPSELMAYAAGNVGGDFGSTQGGADYSSNAYKLDGVDVSDPQTGTTWVFVNMESLDEVELLPISGSTADVGGFTGAAVNMVTKSGGNDFSGGFAYYYLDKDFIAWNTDDEDLRDNASRNALNNDFTGFIGGPVLKDRVWFFGNVGLRKQGTLYGFTNEQMVTEKYRNTMWKASTVLRDDMNLWGMYHYDNYLVDGRFKAYNRAEEATADQDGPNHSFAVHYAWVIDNDNLFEAKFHGWDGRFGYTGKGSGPYYYDLVQDYGYGNSPYDYNTWRDRTNFEGIYTRYLNDMGGDHVIKAGVEYQTGSSEYKVRYDWILLLDGENYYRYGNYPDDEGLQKFDTWIAYITDSWSVNDRLLINAGVRVERPNYNIPDQGDIKSFNNLAPRIGFTYKIDDAGRTLVRGSYGWYYETVTTGLLSELYTGASPWIEYIWDGADWFEVYREDYSQSLYSLDPDLKGQYVEAFTFGFEHELMPNVAVGADYVHRSSRDIIAKQERGNTWEATDVTFEGTTYTVFDRVAADPDYLVFNAPNDVLFNKYDALILSATKRYSDNWQAQVSLTLSDFRGTGGYTSGAITGDDGYYDNPNNQINAEGKFPNHVPWNLKMIGAYTFPYDITVAGFGTYRSGRSFTRTLTVTGLGQGEETIFVEPRGGNSYDPVFYLDMRAEKAFHLDRFSFSLLLDVYNLFNNGTTTATVNQIDLSTYGDPTNLQNPRIIQLGARFSF